MNINNNNLCLLLLPYFIFLLLSLPSSSSSSSCNHLDSSALLLFKNSLNTSSHFPSKTYSWINGTDCCEWDGITCDIISGHVIGLDLSYSNLQGQLHPNSTIFSLRHLQQLNLAYNDFSGSSLYSAIGDLVNLMHLNLSYSQISGDIPSTISHLSKLLSLDLRGFDLIIRDPNYPRMKLDAYTWKKLIQNATNLRELYLHRVDMSSIRESSLSLLTNLSSSLISLSLSATELHGNFPTDILCLPNLPQLLLYENEKLRGELPKSNWTAPLSYLALAYTAFSGNIPDSIGHLKSLKSLALQSCNFEGLIPSSLFNLTQLSALDLSFNKLVGPIPSKINKLSKLQFLYLTNNKLNATIPYWCYSLPSLLWLDLSDNHLTGSIGEFSSYSLEYLSLSNNKLQGSFPNSIFELPNLSGLSLASTDLSGHLDFHLFSKIKYLGILDLSDNSLLSINFDSTVDYILPNLQSLYLSSCNINSFPKFLAPLELLLNLDLSHNNIRGSIPQWFQGKLLHSWNYTITLIDLSFNKLQGDVPIPPNGIRYFLVSNNELTRNIPSAMCNASLPLYTQLGS